MGVRQDESPEREKRYHGRIDNELLPPHEFMPGKYPKYLEKLGVMFRVPIIEWSTKEVMEKLDGEENPLYRQGFERVGCFPCLASGDRWKEKAFGFDSSGKAHYKQVQDLECETGKSIWTSKSGKYRNGGTQDDMFGGCAICAI